MLEPTEAVVIFWEDASIQKGIVDDDNFNCRMPMVSAGILVKESELFVSIAVDWCPIAKHYRDVSNIPRGMINSIKRGPLE